MELDTTNLQKYGYNYAKYCIFLNYIRIVVDCGPLDNPANGLVNTESRTTYNSGAVYSCNEGHQLTGRVLATCMANGQWSSSTPTCDRKPVIHVHWL